MTAKECWARVQLNLIFSWHSFLALGCPVRAEDLSPSSLSSSDRARGFAVRLLDEVTSFGDSALIDGSFFPSGSRSVLHDLVEKMQEHKYSARFGCMNVEQAVRGAKAVKVDRVAVPDVAGTVEISPWLCEERAFDSQL